MIKILKRIVLFPVDVLVFLFICISLLFKNDDYFDEMDGGGFK